MESYVKISMTKSDNRIDYQIKCSEDIQKLFINKKIYFEYNQRIDHVPDSILFIPIVSTIISLSWAIGFDVYVDVLDRDYYLSLLDIKKVMQQWFQGFSFNSKIITNLKANKQTNKSIGMLFSGGIDSLFSYTNNSKIIKKIFTIHGADIDVSDKNGWKLLYSKIRQFARKNNLLVLTVKTNMKELVNDGYLSERFHLVSWWGQVTHGLMLTGSISPLAYNHIKTLIIASTHSRKFHYPWGSSPRIDNKIKYGGINILHNGFKFTRVEKILYFSNRPDLLKNLKVCYQHAKKINCSNCEKCYRTIIGLIIAGIDPNKCNFSINKRGLLKIKKEFQRGWIKLEKGHKFAWNDSQNNFIDNRINQQYKLKKFWNWFNNFDFNEYKSKQVESRMTLIYKKITKIKLYQIMRKIKQKL